MRRNDALKILLAYLLAGAALLPLYWLQIDADGISYISIARRYAAGDWAGAVNGYWGPLLSWLLAPFVAAGVNPLTAAKIIGLFTGAAALAGTYLLMRRFEISRGIGIALLSASGIAVYSFFAAVISPDLLVAACLVFYLYFVFDGDYLRGRGPAIAAACCGALGYYSKSYALPFFLAHFTLMSALHGFYNPSARRRALLSWLAGLAVFAALCAPWAWALSRKYGKFTVNTTGKYNHAVVGPGYRGHPVNYEGFFAPSDARAISVWEDPSAIPVRAWSAFGSWAGFRHQCVLLAKNCADALAAYHSMSFFSAAIMLFAALAALDYRNPAARIYVFSLATLAVYTGGYLPLVVRGRYLCLGYMLVLLLGGQLMTRLFENYLTGKIRRAVVLSAFCAAFLYSPLVNLCQGANLGRDWCDTAGIMKGRYALSGRNVASNARWMETLYLAYYLDYKYYGQARPGIGGPELERELAERKINYFFVWESPSFSLPGWQDLPVPKPEVLRILYNSNSLARAS